jgi:hypothetical protein
MMKFRGPLGDTFFRRLTNKQELVVLLLFPPQLYTSFPPRDRERQKVTLRISFSFLYFFPKYARRLKWREMCTTNTSTITKYYCHTQTSTARPLLLSKALQHKYLLLKHTKPLHRANWDVSFFLYDYFYSCSAPTEYLCVLCGSENKQRLFHYTALTGWLYNRDRVCLLRGTFCPHSAICVELRTNSDYYTVQH